jgi:Ca-activated chloride channel family protein
MTVEAVTNHEEARMTTRRSQLLTAAALLLATAAIGAAARGVSRAPVAAPPNHAASFAAPATGPVSFTGTLDRTAVLLGHDGLARIELAVAAASDDAARHVRRPTDVVVILDRSGSMGGEKIAHARAAVRELLAQLGPQDRFALVTYSDEARVTIPLSAVDEAQRRAWLAAVDAIQPDGGTNMSSGLDLGLDTIERGRADGRVPHVVLISDGLANQGDPSPEGLMRRARRAAQGEYMLSSVGVGEDFNEYLMTALADAGTGNYYYVQDPRELGGVFAREFDAARTTVASGLAIQIEPGPGVRVVDAAGYPLEAAGSGVLFRPGSLFAGQDRRIWVTLAVPQQTVGEYELGRFTLSYGEAQDRHSLSFSEVPRIACVQGEDQFYANVDASAWSRSVVVDAYNKMQEEVARAVKDGRRDRALERLRAFKDETAAMNARIQSAPVAGQLHAADELEARVSGAFEGANQPLRQNELSKSTSADAIDARRAGSKK